jgi:hypothetical protein
MGENVQDIAAPETFYTQFAVGRDFFEGDLYGDLTVSWAETHVDKVAEKLQKMMDEKGVVFFIVGKTTGLLRNKTTVTPVERDKIKEQTGEGRKVWLKNEDLRELVASGICDLADVAGVGDIKGLRVAASGQEAATNNTVAIKQKEGG